MISLLLTTLKTKNCKRLNSIYKHFYTPWLIYLKTQTKESYKGHITNAHRYFPELSLLSTLSTYQT